MLEATYELKTSQNLTKPHKTSQNLTKPHKTSQNLTKKCNPISFEINITLLLQGNMVGYRNMYFGHSIALFVTA